VPPSLCDARHFPTTTTTNTTTPHPHPRLPPLLPRVQVVELMGTNFAGTDPDDPGYILSS
jgi:hypothetical protein